MKKLRLLAVTTACCILALAAQSCSDDTTNPATQIEVFAEMTSRSVTSMRSDDSHSIKQTFGDIADSIHISKVRILVKRLKLHRSAEDTVSGDKEVKAGPFLITIDSAGQRSVTNSTIQDGTYDKVKFEIHRFSSSEISTYLNDPIFADFVTGDRYSTIIDLKVYKSGQVFPFSFRSEATSNLSLALNPALTINNSNVGALLLQLQPSLTFRLGADILDPRDPRNKKDIENGLKKAIRALKR